MRIPHQVFLNLPNPDFKIRILGQLVEASSDVDTNRMVIIARIPRRKGKVHGRDLISPKSKFTDKLSCAADHQIAKFLNIQRTTTWSCSDIHRRSMIKCWRRPAQPRIRWHTKITLHHLFYPPNLSRMLCYYHPFPKNPPRMKKSETHCHGLVKNLISAI